ncbi:uncharacterized protein LOC119072437 [Bradysia coprophila]|uniref:uncharacterized protein LOC119072437 n=1 Tax=Bradysia coprophila TaxID=38358 RepID=UPI00187DBBBB|nr:uncharacterized protein LOC119072437 [Bradysia coprophila]
MFSIRIILLIIVSVAAENAYEDCIYFDKGSGFVKLSPLVSNELPVKLRMQVKAYNCDDISMTVYIGNKYKFNTPTQGSFMTIGYSISDYGINDPCNGLWHNAMLDLNEKEPLFHWNDQTFYRADYEQYDFERLRGETVYVGFQYHNQTDDKYIKFKSYDKPFEGYIRNITIDGVAQSMLQGQLNGTLVSKACPTEAIFTSTEGAAKLNDNVSIDSDNFRISFELKITNCSECCSSSAILLSAIGEDSYFVLEIVQNILYWKTKAPSYSTYDYLTTLGEYQLCDGNWHKIAVLQQGRDYRIIADNHSTSNNFGQTLKFTAPLYVGQHPFFKMLSSIEIRNGFKGCFRSLQVNGAGAEISENNFNDFAKLGSCNKVNVL